MGFFGNLAKKSEENLFFKSCKYGDENQITRMVRRTPQLATATDQNGASGLIHAAMNGHAGSVSLILNVSSEAVNILEPFKEGSPLLYATMTGNISIVRQLLENGANPNLWNCDGVTPLHIAADKEFLDIIVLLIQYNANLMSKDSYGNTPKDLINRCGNIEIENAVLGVLENKNA